MECIEKEKKISNISQPLIFHCDREIQYVSEAFRNTTEEMMCSYSKHVKVRDADKNLDFHKVPKGAF